MSYPVNLWHGRASVRLVRLDAKMYALSTLYSMDRGKGDARAVMQQAIDYADRKGITLRLIVQGFGDTRGLTNPQLEEFYAKFGFVKDPSDVPYPVCMTRRPLSKRENHA